MKIVYYEMRKSWLKLTTLIVLILFLGLNLLRIYDSCRTQYTFTFGRFHDPYYQLYGTVCGELSEEKLGPFRARAKELADIVKNQSYSTKYDPEKNISGYCFGDFNLYNTFIGPEITYCATYSNLSNQIAAKAYDNYFFYTESGMEYETEKALLLYNAFSNRGVPEYRATYWTKLFFRHDFSSLLCVIMLILGLSASFSAERESGMNQLIVSSGKMKKTATAKMFSSAIYCAFLSIVFTLCDITAANILLGVDGLDMPVYSAPIFEESPFTFSFLSAILLWIGIRFLALFSLSLIMLFISRISPNTIIAMIGSFGVLMLLIILTTVSESVFNPFCALVPNAYITDFSVVNFFGKPILTLFAAVMALTAECVVLSIGILFCGRILGRRADV